MTTRYPLDQIYEEVAFVAYHFHWSHDDVLNMPHWERKRWCEEISRINERINEGTENRSKAVTRSLEALR